MPRLSIAIDTKNLALYGRGISGFVKPLMAAWLREGRDTNFYFVGPPFDTSTFSQFKNWEHKQIPWPVTLPRMMRHPVYDNLLFPRVISKLKPDVLFSPYHDVRIPKTRDTYSIIAVHDTCLEDLCQEYPAGVRLYFVAMLKRNLRYAQHVLTVSETSRARVIERHGLSPETISVIYNSIDPEFDTAPMDPLGIQQIVNHSNGDRIIFYPGGPAWRKNVPRLLEAFALLVSSGERVQLVATGVKCPVWSRELAKLAPGVQGKVRFVGQLSVPELKSHYAAADTAVYPTLCEGFGRVCIEAMWVGTPIACSNLPVLREVAHDYPVYFDPERPGEIAESLKKAMRQGRLRPRQDARFLLPAVVADFSALIGQLLSGVRR